MKKYQHDDEDDLNKTHRGAGQVDWDQGVTDVKAEDA